MVQNYYKIFCNDNICVLLQVQCNESMILENMCSLNGDEIDVSKKINDNLKHEVSESVVFIFIFISPYSALLKLILN